MDGEHTREFQMSRFAVALAAIALFAAVLAPTAGATSPSQDQYGSALPGVGNDNGSGNPGGSNPSDSGGQSTIPVAPSSSGTQKGNTSSHSGNGGHSKAGSKGGSSHKDKGNGSKGGSNKAQHPVTANTAGQSVPHIAADSASDSWVPWFIAGLLALAGAGGIIVYRNRRRAAQS
jgi:hypothetical protein